MVTMHVDEAFAEAMRAKAMRAAFAEQDVVDEKPWR